MFAIKANFIREILSCFYRFGQKEMDEVENGGPGILARGLFLTGAAWDPEKNVLIEGDR